MVTGCGQHPSSWQDRNAGCQLICPFLSAASKERLRYRSRADIWVGPDFFFYSSDQESHRALQKAMNLSQMQIKEWEQKSYICQAKLGAK